MIGEDRSGSDYGPDRGTASKGTHRWPAKSDKRVPEVARACIAALGTKLRVLKTQILQFDRMINAWHRSSEVSKRLDEIPGVGRMRS
jgi:hypothetical protein